MNLSYHAGTSEIKIIEAKTVTEEGEFLVKPEHIQDKSVAGGGQGFDDTRQVSIVFPNLAVNVWIEGIVEFNLKSPIFQILTVGNLISVPLEDPSPSYRKKLTRLNQNYLST